MTHNTAAAGYSQEVMDYCSILTEYGHKREPFVLVEECLCFGPTNIELGDIMVVLLEFVPFIPRCVSGTTYHLVREAYIDRVMDGEDILKLRVVS